MATLPNYQLVDEDIVFAIAIAIGVAIAGVEKTSRPGRVCGEVRCPGDPLNLPLSLRDVGDGSAVDQPI